MRLPAKLQWLWSTRRSYQFRKWNTLKHHRLRGLWGLPASSQIREPLIRLSRGSTGEHLLRYPLKSLTRSQSRRLLSRRPQRPPNKTKFTPIKKRSRSLKIYAFRPCENKSRERSRYKRSHLLHFFQIRARRRYHPKGLSWCKAIGSVIIIC